MNEKKSSGWALFVGGLGLIVTVTAIILFVDWLNRHIDERVDQKVSEEAFANKISETIRPYVLFNQNGTILYDGGGMSYIDSLQTITTGQGTGLMVMKIIVTPKRFIKVIPLLWCLDITEHTYRPIRGERYKIIYNLINPNISGLDEIRFRLEILK